MIKYSAYRNGRLVDQTKLCLTCEYAYELPHTGRKFCLYLKTPISSPYDPNCSSEHWREAQLPIPIHNLI